MEEDVSQPGNFPHSSDKMGREVPEHSNAVSFAKDNGHDNFLSDDTTIIPTTDIQVRSVLFVLTIWGPGTLYLVLPLGILAREFLEKPLPIL